MRPASVVGRECCVQSEIDRRARARVVSNTPVAVLLLSVTEHKNFPLTRLCIHFLQVNGGVKKWHKKIEMIDISTIVLRDLAGAPAHWVDYGRSHHPDPIPRRAVRALAPFLLAFVGALEGRMAPDRGRLATTT